MYIKQIVKTAPMRDATEDEIKKMFAETISLLIIVLMNSHVYKFGGKLRLQSGNGSIGDRATGIIAQFVMIWWERIFKNKLKNLNIQNDLLERYIDDVNIVCDAVQPGTDYVTGKLVMNKEKEVTDMEKPIDMVTMNVVRKIADDISDMLKFTTDVPSNYEDKRMPVLDMKVALDNSKEIEYVFYEKPMKSKMVIGKASALPNNVKMKTLTQEVFRRMHNTKESILEENKSIILTEYMQKLKTSGYTLDERFNILLGGINTYDKLKKLEKEGKRKFYRPPDITSNERKAKKSMRNDWFKSVKKNKFTSVMFVEATPNGELIKAIREVENKYRIDDTKRIKFVEKCGRKFIDTMRINDPFRTNCAGEECLACVNETKFTNCRKTNVGYTLECKLCSSRGIVKVYEGETCRSMYMRQKEHAKQYEKKQENSVMYKHVVNDHENEENVVHFKMKLSGVFRTPLERIINEGIGIKQ